MKMLPYEVQRENIAVAYSILGGIPAEYFALERYCNRIHIRNVEQVDALKHTCGTIGCALGWLSLHPYFQAQGMYMRDGGVYLRSERGQDDFDAEIAARHLFGYNAWDRFFSSYYDGTNDVRLIRVNNLPPQRYLSTKQDHKTLALARLKDGYYARSRRANKESK